MYVYFLLYFTQVLHGCRQFVLWNVWLIPLTDATPGVINFIIFFLIIDNAVIN